MEDLIRISEYEINLKKKRIELFGFLLYMKEEISCGSKFTCRTSAWSYKNYKMQQVECREA